MNRLNLKKQLSRGAAFVTLLALLINANCRLRAEDAGGGYTDEKIKAFIGDLGNEDFAKRQAAEKELIKAGDKAQKALEAAKESPDAQIKTTVQHLLGRLKFAGMAPVDYLDLLPPNSLLVLKASNFNTLAENAKKSALGKLLDSPGLEAFRQKLKDEVAKKPDTQKLVTDWAKRFNGQFAAAILDLNPMQNDVKMAAIAEITDPNPNDVYDEVVKAIHIGDNGQTGNYADVDYVEGAQQQGAAALIGKHLVLANNLGALKIVIDSFTTPGKFAASERFAKIKPSLGPKPDLLLTVDVEALVKTISQVPFPFPLDDVLSTSGLKNMKFVGFSSAAAGDSFEDRFVQIMNGPPAGINAAYVPPAGVAPLNAAALAPQNSAAIIAGYVDGVKFHAGVMEYLAAMKKMRESAQAMGMPANDKDPETEIKAFEEKSGLKMADLAAMVKGEIAFWGNPAAEFLSPPDIGAVITCESPEKAAALSDALVKLVNLGKDKPVVSDAPYKNRVIHLIDVAGLVPDAPKNAPYTPAWTVDGNRIFLGSSGNVLQKQITAIDTKAPGLLTQQDFVKAIGNLSEEERKGSVLYVDMKTLLTMGASVGLPALQMQSKDEDLKKALAALPAPSELFKDIPPLLGASTVVGNESKSVLRAAVPPIPTLFLVLVGATLFNNRDALGLGDMIPDK
jgi:hypothetical protein